jgi:hypothetical protein
MTEKCEHKKYTKKWIDNVDLFDTSTISSRVKTLKPVCTKCNKIIGTLTYIEGCLMLKKV